MRHFSSSWSDNLLARLGFRRKRRRQRNSDRFHMRRRPQIESLEQRAMLASDLYLVTTLADVVDANDGYTSLREAITLAATDDSTTDNDTIQFDGSLFTSGPATLTLGTAGALVVGSDVTIAGPDAAQLTVDGNDLSRVFQISGGVTATISGMTISGGNVTGTARGAGIYNSGDLTINAVVFEGNVAQEHAGGIYNNYGKLKVTDSTFYDNQGGNAGGAISSLSNSADALVIERSAFINNQANSGGAIRIHGASSGGTATIINSTFSGNTAAQNAGAIRLTNSAPILTIVNSTITDNHAVTDGGGLHYGGGSIRLYNSIVAGNTAGYAHSDDILGNISSLSSYNLLGADESGQPGSNHVFTDSVGLGALGNYGGPTQTHALLADSPAIDGGSNALALDASGNPLTVDQRGFARDVDLGPAGPSGGTVDIGAVEFSFSDPLVVSTLSDEYDADFSSGDLSLREAIGIAALLPGADTIEFDSSLFAAGPATITLGTSGQLVVDSDVSIVGPGATQLSISGNDQSRVMVVNGGVTATVHGVTLTEGYVAGSGGAIYNSGDLTLDEVVVVDSQATSHGGAIHSSNGSTGMASLHLINSTIDNNRAVHGAGLNVNVGGGALEIFRSTISNNQVLDGVGYAEAGGLRLSGTATSTVSIVNSTFAHNRSIYDGGIRVWSNSAPITIVNSTIADNIGDEGGGIDNKSAGSLITLHNTIVARNTTNASSPKDTFGSFNTSSSNNLIGTGASGLSTSLGNQLGSTSNPLNPQLAPLGDYGGPTKTFALLANSPAIDKGSDALALDANGNPLTIDQRGFTRSVDSGTEGPTGGIVDIGAYESAGTIVAITTSTPTIDEGSQFTLNLTSDPGDYVIDHWVINWGDGSAAETIEGNPLGAAHYYMDNPEPPDTAYTITASVYDASGNLLAIADPLDVTVNNVAPVFSGGTGLPAETKEGSPQSLYLQASFFDPGWDDFTVLFDPGDGREPFEPQFDIYYLNPGDLFIGSSVTVVVPLNYADDGVYTAKLSVWDDDEGVLAGEYVGQITVTNVAPRIEVSADTVEVDEGELYTINFSAFDPGDDTVSQWEVNWGDGTVDTVDGTESSAQHRYADDGQYAITVEATDEDGTYVAVPLALDHAFGTGGKVLTDDYMTGGVTATQSDGKLLVGGSTGGPGYEFALSRYNVDGSLDTDFGTEGLVTIGSLAGRSVIVSGENIYVAGSSDNKFGVMRYDLDGNLDTDFGTNGVATLDFISSSYDVAESVAIQWDGKIVVGGWLQGGHTVFALGRFKADGTPDSSFGDDGMVTSDFSPVYSNLGYSVAIDPTTHTILLAGKALGKLAVARYDEDGDLDTSFGDGGLAADLGGNFGSMAVQTDGKFVLGGSDGSDFALVRYYPNGTLDESFDGDGMLTTDLGGYDHAHDIAIQPDGKIVAAGYSYSNSYTSRDFALVQYLANGTPDPDFGAGGKLTLDFGGGEDANSVVLQPDGKIVLVGTSHDPADGNNKLALAKYLPSSRVTVAVFAASGVSATANSNTRVRLEWEDNASDEIGFAIEKSTDGTEFEFAGWAEANAEEYVVTALNAGTHYWFRVNAYSETGYAPSDAAEATTASNLPLSPDDLSVAEVFYDRVQLTWFADSSSEQDGFIVEQSLDGETFEQIAELADPMATAATIDGLSSNTVYYFRIKAYNDVGDSSYSSVVETETTPAAPRDVTAVAESTGEIRLTWDGMPTLASEPSDNPDLTFAQSDGGTALYVYDQSSTPLSSVVGYGDSPVGDDYVLTGNIVFDNTGTELGFYARGDAQGDNGYVLSLDPITSEFKLVKLTSGVSTDLVNHTVEVWVNNSRVDLDINANDTFKITLEVNGDDLTGRIYSSAGLLLDTIEATDSSYSSGSVGTWALKQSGSIEGTWSSMHFTSLSGSPDGYRIEQSGDGEEFVEVATAWGPEFTVGDLAPGTTYYFRVRALKGEDNSEYSNTADAITVAATAAPAAPASLHAQYVTGEASIKLTWDDSSDNESGFRIEQSTDGQVFSEVAVTQPNCTDWTITGLLPGTYYYFRVRAYNNYNGLSYSGYATANKSTYGGINVAPTVATAASASLNPAETSASLSVLGADNSGEPSLIYAWAATMLPAGAIAPEFSANGTNAAKNSTVTFHTAGTYWLTATITDQDGLSTTSSVALTVEQVAQNIEISPTSVSLDAGETQQFTATGIDQFGDSLVTSTLMWSATGGTIDSSGLYVAPNTSDAFTIAVQVGAVSDDTTVTVVNHSPTISNAAAAVQVPATATVSLSALGDDSDPTGESNLTYTWSAVSLPGGAIVTFGDENGSNAGKSTIATVDALGEYEFQVTVSDGDSSPVTSNVVLEVTQTLTSTTVSPSSPTVDVGESQQFSAIGYDQFGDPMATQPTFLWSATIGLINSDGQYTAPRASVPDTVTAESDGVSGFSDVIVSNPDPTLSSRLGDSSLQTYWEESLGSPDTRQERLEQAAGTTTMMLDTTLDDVRVGAGFVIDPTSTFALTNPQDMASPQVFSSDPAPANYEWEVGGVTFASSEDLNSTLSYQITVVAGVWTYTETFISSYDIVTTADGEDFSSISGSYGYTFTATGDADGSEWVYEVTVTAPVASPTGDGQWSQATSTTDTITNTTNVTANTRSGSRSGSGGATWTFPEYNSEDHISDGTGGNSFSYSVDYVWSPTEGWSTECTATNTKSVTISNTVAVSMNYSFSNVGWNCTGNANNSSTDTWSYTYTTTYELLPEGTWEFVSGSGESSGNGSSHESVDEGGSYWPTTVDETISGSFSDGSEDSSSYSYSTTAVYTDGAWIQSGSATVNRQQSGYNSFSGSGSYPDASGSGSQEESSNVNYSSDAVKTFSLTSGGWQLSSGNAHTQESSSLHKAYSISTQTSSGTTSESGELDYSDHCEEAYEASPGGGWDLTSANYDASGSGYSRMSQSSSGSYSDSGPGWSISGEYQQEQKTDSDFNFDVSKHFTGGAWTYDGSAEVSDIGSSNYSYSGSGSYSGEGGNGTTSQSGHDKASFEHTANYQKEADGTWLLESAHDESSGDGATKWSYSITSPYSDGDLSGSQSAGGGNTTAYDYLTSADYSGGNWTYGGHTVRSHGTTAESSYSGNGEYTYPIPGGAITGSVNGNGQSKSELTYGANSTRNSDGTWSSPTVTETSKSNSEDHWSYSGGSGSYSTYSGSWLGSPVEIDVTISLTGGHDDHSSAFEATRKLDGNGIWSVTGNGAVSSSSSSGYSFSGSGSAGYLGTTYTVSEEGSGSFKSDHAEHWSPTGGGWSLTSVSDREDGDSAASYEYEAIDEDGHPVPTFERDFDTKYRLRKTDGVGSSSTKTDSHGTIELYYHPFINYPFEAYDTFDATEESITNYYADGTTSSSYEVTNSVKGEDYGYSYDTTIQSPGFYGLTCIDRYDSGLYPTFPLSGFSAGPAHGSGAGAALMVAQPAGGEVGSAAFSIETNGALLNPQTLIADTSSTDPSTLFQAPHVSGPSFKSSPATSNGFTRFDSAEPIPSVVDANFGVTRFTYDPAGNMASLTDPVQNTTQWSYDDQGRVTQETNSLGDSRYYAYDAEGDLVRYVDRNGQVRTYQYDSGHHVTVETWYASVADADGNQNVLNTIHYDYDSAGRLISESDDLTSVSYAYDDADRVVSTTESSIGGPTVVLIATYEGTSTNCSTLTAIVDGVVDYVEEYTYDNHGRVASVTQHGDDNGNSVAEKRAEITYSDAGQVQSINRYLGSQLVVTSDYAYDSLGKLTGLVHHQGTTILNSYRWTYEPSGFEGILTYTGSTSSNNAADISAPSGQWMLPVHKTEGIAAALTASTYASLSLITEIQSADGIVQYSYDATGQLTGATYSDGILSDEVYTYDANGNRTNSGYVTGAGNRLFSDGIYAYTYDAEGNRVARFIDVNEDGLLNSGDTDVSEYGWDVRNRMIEVTHRATADGAPTQIVDLFYDVEDRWIGENVDEGGDGTVDHQTRFAYVGNQIVLQFDKDGSDDVTGGDLSHRYMWQPDLVDRLMADEHVTDLQTPGNVIWPLGDQLETIRDLVAYNAETGDTTVVNHRVYDSFGNLTSQSNAAVDTLFGFAGLAYDAKIDLNMSQTRPYDARAGRWISEDWIGFNGNDTNLYRYSANSPATHSDPSGMAVQKPIHLSDEFSVKVTDVYAKVYTEQGNASITVHSPTTTLTEFFKDKTLDQLKDFSKEKLLDLMGEVLPDASDLARWAVDELNRWKSGAHIGLQFATTKLLVCRIEIYAEIQVDYKVRYLNDDTGTYGDWQDESFQYEELLAHRGPGFSLTIDITNRQGVREIGTHMKEMLKEIKRKLDPAGLEARAVAALLEWLDDQYIILPPN